MFVSLNSDGRIITVSSTPCGNEHLEIDLPVDFDDGHILDYQVIDGVITYDPLPLLSEPTPQPTMQEQLDAQADAIAELAAIIAGGEA